MIYLSRPRVFVAATFCPARRALSSPGADIYGAPDPQDCRRASAPEGLPIIEALVALAFLAVFAAGIVGLSIAILTGNAKSQASDTAVSLALDKRESTRNTAYSSVPAGTVTQNYGTITVTTMSGTTPVTVTYPDCMRTTVATVLSRRGSSVSKVMIIGQ